VLALIARKQHEKREFGRDGICMRMCLIRGRLRRPIGSGERQGMEIETGRGIGGIDGGRCSYFDRMGERIECDSILIL